jgi:hypothetical protein
VRSLAGSGDLLLTGAAARRQLNRRPDRLMVSTQARLRHGLQVGEQVIVTQIAEIYCDLTKHSLITTRLLEQHLVYLLNTHDASSEEMSADIWRFSIHG